MEHTEIPFNIAGPNAKWMTLFEGQREQPEISLNRIYAKRPHGTSGHIERMLIAKMASMLDLIEKSGVDICAIVTKEIVDGKG